VIALHAVWARDSRLCVWGEDSRLPAPATYRREEALAEGDRALVFTQFAELGHMLKGHLQERLGREALFLHGGTPKSARDEMVARFQGDGGLPRSSCSRSRLAVPASTSPRRTT
jgi:SNF2 family DNA or RNA helicase